MRREASGGLDICRGNAGRRARRGFVGSDGVVLQYSKLGEIFGVSREKWVAGVKLK